MGSFTFSQNTLVSFLPFLKAYITSDSVLHVSIPQSSPGRYAAFSHIYLSEERSTMILRITVRRSLGPTCIKPKTKKKVFLIFFFFFAVALFSFFTFFITFFVVSFLWRTLPVSANRRRGLWRLVQRTASSCTSSFTFYFWDMFVPFDKKTPLTGYAFVSTLFTRMSAYNKKSFVTFSRHILESEIRLAHTGGACANPGTRRKCAPVVRVPAAGAARGPTSSFSIV